MNLAKELFTFVIGVGGLLALVVFLCVAKGV